MQGKIALEEHLMLPSFGAYGADASALDGATKAHNYDPGYFAAVQKRLGEATLRLEDMDRCGIERVILSLTQPGIQGIPDRRRDRKADERRSGRALPGGTSENVFCPETLF